MSFTLLRQALKEPFLHVSPFLVLGDPTPDISVALAEAAVKQGATMLEIGFPYGDPVADGPAIQEADARAMRGGTSTRKAIELLCRIRGRCPKTPLNLLVYGNLVHASGYPTFCRAVAEAGASSLLVPDIPVDEARALRRASRSAELGHVELVGPLTPPERLQKIERAADAFLYLVAHQGVTGVRNESFEPVAELVRRIRVHTRRPLCLGFGLSRPEHMEGAARAGAHIAVVGSHLARVIGRAWGESEKEDDVVHCFVDALRPLLEARTAVTRTDEGPVHPADGR